MAVDPCLPSLIFLVWIGAPVFFAFRNTRVFFIVAGIESAIFFAFYMCALRYLEPSINRGMLGFCFAMYAVPLVAGLAICYGRVNRRKIDHSICAVCGYDLRATPDRCPECGTTPPKKEIISN
jgi:hypothetical protein